MDCKNICTCALVGAADFCPETFLARHYDRTIAVDGGYAHMKACGVTPDLALGDFDSLGFVPQDVPHETFPVAKDASDLALALRRAREMGATHIDVYGALGGRPDHTYATYQALRHASEAGAVVRAFAGEGGIVILTAQDAPCTWQMPDVADETFSVFAMSDTCEHVSIEGFRYELHDGTMTADTPLGLSNVTIDTSGTISVGRGTLIVFLPEGLMRALTVPSPEA